MKLTITADAQFRSSHKSGSLSPLREPDEITARLGVQPDTDDIDADKQTMEWRFIVNGKPCAIWDYKGVRWSCWGDHAALAALFSDYLPGDVRQSQAA